MAAKSLNALIRAIIMVIEMEGLFLYELSLA